MIAQENPKVLMKTSMGDITIELFQEKAPVSVENFLSYVEDGFYDGLIFHRVIKDFMIQGGGYDAEMNKKDTKDPIKNEATNGLKNKRGTLAYARTSVINSATSQFFINHVDNSFLNHKSKNPQEYGYAVFGEVVDGMDVVDKIANVKVHSLPNGMQNVPVEPVVIESVSLIEEKEDKE
ncbi:MAG: peptidylprolyl isomerase [bacterium]